MFFNFPQQQLYINLSSFTHYSLKIMKEIYRMLSGYHSLMTALISLGSSIRSTTEDGASVLETRIVQGSTFITICLAVAMGHKWRAKSIESTHKAQLYILKFGKSTVSGEARYCTHTSKLQIFSKLPKYSYYSSCWHDTSQKSVYHLCPKLHRPLRTEKPEHPKSAISEPREAKIHMFFSANLSEPI